MNNLYNFLFFLYLTIECLNITIFAYMRMKNIICTYTTDGGVVQHAVWRLGVFNQDLGLLICWSVLSSCLVRLLMTFITEDRLRDLYLECRLQFRLWSNTGIVSFLFLWLLRQRNHNLQLDDTNNSFWSRTQHSAHYAKHIYQQLINSTNNRSQSRDFSSQIFRLYFCLSGWL